jgi:hypothetical protein
LEHSWRLNTTLQAQLSDYDCAETDDADPVSKGSVIECRGLLSDLRCEAFQAEPAAVTGRYAVTNGQIVNAMFFDAGPPPEWASLLDRYLDENQADEMAAACADPESSGQARAQLMQQHLDEAASAWSQQ